MRNWSGAFRLIWKSAGTMSGSTRARSGLATNGGGNHRRHRAEQPRIVIPLEVFTRDPGVCLDELAIAIGVKGGNIQTVLVESERR